MNTEQEARGLWCPMVRSAAFLGKNKIGPAVNRVHYDEEGRDVEPCGFPQPYALCVASQCAMWRWLPADEPHWIRAEFTVATKVSESGGAVFTGKIPDPDRFEFRPWDGESDPEEWPAGWMEKDESRAARRQGYCGLAGKPASQA